ncbi:ketopantoate reductase family protein [bacterium]|nr:ketopantoate reductase family protein [bacterium]
MKKINKVIICGLGALGLTYATRLFNCCDLKILANQERIEKYLKNPPNFNGKFFKFNYLNPNDKFDADLIIITTKSLGLNLALEYLKNFVSKKTIIISLINGISSEEKILKAYPQAEVLRSYFIGHSAMRAENFVSQDGIGKIVLEPNINLETFFQEVGIDYEISNDIIYSQWVKLGVNIVLNQLSAIYKCNVGNLKRHPDYLYYRDNLLEEVKIVANACGVKNLIDYKKDVLNSIDLIANDGNTSMYQDIIAKRETEVKIFSGEIVNLGKKYNIETPYNYEIYSKFFDF